MNTPLTYEVLLPSELIEEQTYPAIYVLHGIGSNEQDILALVENLKENFIIISIRGSHDREDGYSHYHIEGFGNPVKESFDQCIQWIIDLMVNCAEQYPVDTDRQYVLGFSQGAAIAMTIACTLGNKIKGIVALSGYLPNFVKENNSLPSMHEVSVYISHGNYDPLFPLREARENQSFFQEHSEKVDFVSYFARHEVTLENKQSFMEWLHADLKESYSTT